METIGLKDFIDSKYEKFALHYYETLQVKVSAFVKANTADLALDNSIAPDQFVYGDRVIMILVSGKEIQATLKIHYSPSEVIKLMPQKLIESSESPDFAIESFFAEMANLIAGRLKASFMDMNYVVGISLPIRASCYDELVSSDKLVANRAYSFTGIKLSTHSRFVISLAIDDHGEGLKAFKPEAPDEKESDDFL